MNDDDEKDVHPNHHLLILYDPFPRMEQNPLVP
jgi:hypothetical protein